MNNAASIKARLRNLAAKEHKPYDYVQTHYMIERLLYLVIVMATGAVIFCTPSAVMFGRGAVPLKQFSISGCISSDCLPAMGTEPLTSSAYLRSFGCILIALLFRAAPRRHSGYCL